MEMVTRNKKSFYGTVSNGPYNQSSILLCMERNRVHGLQNRNRLHIVTQHCDVAQNYINCVKHTRQKVHALLDSNMSLGVFGGTNFSRHNFQNNHPLWKLCGSSFSPCISKENTTRGRDQKWENAVCIHTRLLWSTYFSITHTNLAATPHPLFKFSPNIQNLCTPEHRMQRLEPLRGLSVPSLARALPLQDKNTKEGWRGLGVKEGRDLPRWDLGPLLLLGGSGHGAAGLSLLQDHVGLVVHSLLSVVLSPRRTVVGLACLRVDRCNRHSWRKSHFNVQYEKQSQRLHSKDIHGIHIIINKHEQ